MTREASTRERILEQAKVSGFEAGQAEGYAIGQAAGYQAGYDQAYAEASSAHGEQLRAFTAALQKTHDGLEESIAQWFEASEKELETMAIAIAEHLISSQLNLDRSFVTETTKHALREISEANRARIRVNPFDAVILSNSREELLAANASLRGVEIVDDASIYGGCVIETERGAVDATIETRLELLQGGLEEAA